MSEPDINQFLGAMNKYQADYGVFITNSRFTNKAREAAREGTPITLIDGNDLIRLVIKYELYTAYFLRLIQLVSMLYDCRNIIALCALKTNITQNMGRPHCAVTLILILL